MINSEAVIQPDFEIIEPLEVTAPLVFNSPHSGRAYPPDFVARSRLGTLDLRRSEDSFVDDLFHFSASLGCPLLKANFPRAFLDVNREPYELDPDMFADGLPAFTNTSSLRVAGGLGTIARVVGDAAAIYDTKLSWREAEQRIQRYYFPYHAALDRLLTTTRNRFGMAMLVDCHSMPSATARISRFSGRRPDIVLGTLYGQSCDRTYAALLERLFRDQGFRVARDKPYAGGYITHRYGRPHEALHAVQIEINRGLYMDENQITPLPGFAELSNRLNAVFTAFADAIHQQSGPAIAAE